MLLSNHPYHEIQVIGDYRVHVIQANDNFDSYRYTIYNQYDQVVWDYEDKEKITHQQCLENFLDLPVWEEDPESARINAYCSYMQDPLNSNW